MKVPIYDGPQVSQAPAPAGYQSPDAFSGGARAVQGAANQIGAIADRIAQQQDQDFAWRADAKMKTDFAAWEAANKPKYVGAAAAGMADPKTGLNTGSYADQVSQYWKGAASSFGQSLTPTQQRIIDQNAVRYASSTTVDAQHYVMGELEKSHTEAFFNAKAADVQAALRTGTPAAADVAADAIRQKNAEFGVMQGHLDPATGQVDQNWLANQNAKDLTALHANMIAQLQQTNTDAARQYFEAHKGEMDQTRVDDVNKTLQQAEASTKAVQAVGDVFTKFLPPGADPSRGETPLNVTAMQADLESQFKGNPSALSAARAELSSRVNAWKTTESQFQTDAVNTIEDGVAGGKGLPWAMQQPAWATLSGKSKAAITDHLDAKANAALSRANAAEGRADAAEAREDRRLGREHYDTFLDLTMNPDRLAQLTPDQVRAYLPVLGTSLTNSLREQRARLNNDANVKNATLDAQAFQQIAVDQFGMKAPNDPNASKDDKAAFSQMKASVDFVLQEMQTAKKAPLTQAEKAEAMAREMSRTVTVNPGWFSSNKAVPVVQLTADQLKTVVIPDEDRTRIAAQMKDRYARTRDPAYAPTPENLRRWYLLSKSPAGGRFPVSTPDAAAP